MKNKSDSILIPAIFIIATVFFAIVFMGVYPAYTDMRPKPDSQGKCLGCHPQLKENMAKGKPHAPFKKEDCISCHNPHAARYAHLLPEQGDTLCYGCHQAQKEWLKQKVRHSPVAHGECLECHEPHVSPYTHLLREGAKEICFRCHDRGGFQKEYVHSPVKEGRCSICHQVHSSSESYLLIQASPRLCLKCHPADQRLISSHEGFQADAVDCLLCHTPHSSSQKGLMYNNLHEPFADRRCEACHPRSVGTIKPASGRAKGCYTCHKEMEEISKAKRLNHIVSGPEECTFCHNPHGAERKDLVRRGDKPLCTQCHQDMGKRLREVRKGLRRHPEVIAGRCSVCHDAHSSDDDNFLKESPIVLCTGCHSRQKVACHPVGEKALDPRTKTPIDCLTCHDPMESAFPQIMRLDGSKEMCNQCHKY